MSERYVTLLGAEQVQSASRQMESAASQMSRAASQIDDALERHRHWADDWLMRLQQVLEAHTLGETASKP